MRIFLVIFILLLGWLSWALWNGLAANRSSEETAGIEVAAPEAEPLGDSKPETPASPDPAPELAIDLPTAETPAAPAPDSSAEPSAQAAAEVDPEPVPTTEPPEIAPEPAPAADDLAVAPAPAPPGPASDALAESPVPDRSPPAEPLDPIEALAAIAPDLAAPPPEPEPEPAPETASTADPDALWRRVTADRVNLREGPGTDFPSLGLLDEGDLARVLDEEGGWLRVRTTSGTEGWVSARFVAEAEG